VQVFAAVGLNSDTYQVQGNWIHPFVHYFPLMHLSSFVLGIGGALWLLDKQLVVTSSLRSLSLVGAPLFLVFATLQYQDEITACLGFTLGFESSLLGPLFLWLILAIAISRSRLIRLLAWRPFVFLGEVSYSLYILQFPVRTLYVAYFLPMYVVSPRPHFGLYLVLLVVLSSCSYLILEKPMNRLLRGAAKSPPKTA